MRRFFPFAIALAAPRASMACAGTARTTPDTQASPVRVRPAGNDASGSAAPIADALPAGVREAFADADQRARTIAYWYQCVGTIARLRADGTFGPATAAPRLIYCERTSDGIPIGGV